MNRAAPWLLASSLLVSCASSPTPAPQRASEDALTLDGNVAPLATRVEADVRSVEVVPAAVAPTAGGSILGG